MVDAGFPQGSRSRQATFEELSQKSDAELDVLQGALLIAKDEYGSLDIDANVAAIDALAAPLLAQDLKGQRPLHQAEALRYYIYDRQGFRGNEASYYDPKNSFIPDVLERRCGIPITLGLLYVQIARRAGVSADGVGFPGHFLVRINELGREPVLIDPFFGGMVRSLDDLHRMLSRTFGGPTDMKAEFLGAISSRAWLHRLLMNLRSIYLNQGDFARAMLAIDRILSLTPNQPEALLDRAMLFERLSAHAGAIADYERVLRVSPDTEHARNATAALDRIAAKPKGAN